MAVNNPRVKGTMLFLRRLRVLVELRLHRRLL